MLIADYIVSNFEVVKESFPEVHLVCPWCGDSRGKFQFNIEKTVGRCWRASCDKHATLVDLVMKVEQIPFHLAIKKVHTLKKDSGVETYTSNKPTKEYHDVGNLPSGAIPIKDVDSIYEQLTREEQLVIDAGIKYLNNKRHSDFQQLIDVGIAIGLEGKWFGRVLIPALEDGIIVSLTGRTIEIEMPNKQWIPFPGVMGEKYQHPKDSDGYNEKSTVIYGIDDARFSPDIVIVEDPFSVLSLNRSGFNSISFWGVSATDEQRLKLDNKWVSDKRHAIIMLDSDARNMAVKMANQFLNFTQVSLANLRDKDADEDMDGAREAIKLAEKFTVINEISSLLKL